MRVRSVVYAVATGLLVVGISGTYWIGSPTVERLRLSDPLVAYNPQQPLDPLSSKPLEPLKRSFRSQIYRSFCGPATVATVLRAYGDTTADQVSVFHSLIDKLKAFYAGMTLAELGELANSVGLRTQIVYADRLSLESFREQLKDSLGRDGEFAIVNYDRRALGQEGMGHISPVAAYDGTHDAFLVMDEAGYKYPPTWVPARLLYAAVQTQFAGKYRGVLFIRGRVPVS